MTFRFENLIFIIGALLVLAGCHVEENVSNKPTKSSFRALTKAERSEYRKEITALAFRLDRKFEDGWICGRNSRVLKSSYRIVDPEIKADFALAYHKMIRESNQNLAASIGSYVPYDKRFEFALNWWRNSKAETLFQKEKTKKKVQWLHESMLDASELFWRVFEKKYRKEINNAFVLAHDKEQDMVYNYMEKEGNPSTFSNVYVRWKDRLEKEVAAKPASQTKE